MALLTPRSTPTLRLCTLPVLLAPAVAFAAAPIYFDIARLLLFGLAAVVIFATLLITLFKAKSKTTRVVCSLGLLAYVVVPILLSLPSYAIRDKGVTWVLREGERASTDVEAGSLVVSLCQKNATDTSSVNKIAALRLLDAKHLPDHPARGWPTGLDFFVGGTTHQGTDNPASIVDGLKNSFRQLAKPASTEGHVPPVLEFRASDGRWKRYSVTPPAAHYLEEDLTRTRATHGIRFMQVRTGYEEKYKLYAGTIEVVDLETNTVVAHHFSYAHDRYWGAHNHYSLFAGEHCRGLPLGEDFLTNWLRPLLQ